MSQLTLVPGYILDNNTLIAICRRIYPPEIRQSALKIVENLIAQNQILSPNEVYEELKFQKNDKGDETWRWANTNKDIFVDVDEEQAENVAKVLSQFPTFVKYESERPDADPWLVALGMSRKRWTVVSRDGSKDTPGMIKVKQVCLHFKVPCMTDYEFLTKHGWKMK